MIVVGGKASKQGKDAFYSAGRNEFGGKGPRGGGLTSEGRTEPTSTVCNENKDIGQQWDEFSRWAVVRGVSLQR